MNYTADDFARVMAPTLLLLGDRDELVQVEEAAQMYRQMPTAELAIVPGSDHSAFFSAKVDAFRSLMLDFLLPHSDSVGQNAPAERPASPSNDSAINSQEIPMQKPRRRCPREMKQPHRC